MRIPKLRLCSCQYRHSREGYHLQGWSQKYHRSEDGIRSKPATYYIRSAITNDGTTSDDGTTPNDGTTLNDGTATNDGLATDDDGATIDDGLTNDGTTWYGADRYYRRWSCQWLHSRSYGTALDDGLTSNDDGTTLDDGLSSDACSATNGLRWSRALGIRNQADRSKLPHRQVNRSPKSKRVRRLLWAAIQRNWRILLVVKIRDQSKPNAWATTSNFRHFKWSNFTLLILNRKNRRPILPRKHQNLNKETHLQIHGAKPSGCRSSSPHDHAGHGSVPPMGVLLGQRRQELGPRRSESRWPTAEIREVWPNSLYCPWDLLLEIG